MARASGSAGTDAEGVAASCGAGAGAAELSAVGACPFVCGEAGEVSAAGVLPGAASGAGAGVAWGLMGATGADGADVAGAEVSGTLAAGGGAGTVCWSGAAGSAAGCCGVVPGIAGSEVAGAEVAGAEVAGAEVAGAELAGAEAADGTAAAGSTDGAAVAAGAGVRCSCWLTSAGGTATPVAVGVLSSLACPSGMATESGTATDASGVFDEALSEAGLSGTAAAAGPAGCSLPLGMAVSPVSWVDSAAGGCADASVLTAMEEESAAVVALDAWLAGADFATSLVTASAPGFAGEVSATLPFSTGIAVSASVVAGVASGFETPVVASGALFLLFSCSSLLLCSRTCGFAFAGEAASCARTVVGVDCCAAAVSVHRPASSRPGTMGRRVALVRRRMNIPQQRPLVSERALPSRSRSAGRRVSGNSSPGICITGRGPGQRLRTA
jgi:hypothetical protein